MPTLVFLWRLMIQREGNGDMEWGVAIKSTNSRCLILV